MLDGLDGILEKLGPIRVYLSYFIEIFKKLIDMISNYVDIESPFKQDDPSDSTNG